MWNLWYDIPAKKTAWVPGVAGIVLLGAAVYELNYRQEHLNRSGPSGVIAVGFFAAAAVAFSVMFLAAELLNHRGDDATHRTKT